MNSHVGLLSELDISELLSMGHHVLVLDAHNTATPVSSEGLVLVELSAEVGRECLQILEVLLVNFSESNASSGLQVNKLAEVSLSADECEWNILSSAESGQVNNSLNGIDVVGNDNKLGSALFNKGGNVVKTELDVNGLGGLGSSTSFGGGLKTELLLLLSLGHVLSEELKELGSYKEVRMLCRNLPWFLSMVD